MWRVAHGTGCPSGLLLWLLLFSPLGDSLGGPYFPPPTSCLGFLCLSLPPAQGKLRHVAHLSLQDMVLDAEEALEKSSSAMTSSGSQLQWAGQSEASENNPCPICLGEVNNAAYVALCFHRFFFGCIQQWATMRAVCPAGDEEEEDGDGSLACHQRNMAAKGPSADLPGGAMSWLDLP